MGADRKRNAGRAVRIGKLSVVLLAAAFVLAGCGGSTGSHASGLEAENKALCQENERLREEVERL